MIARRRFIAAAAGALAGLFVPVQAAHALSAASDGAAADSVLDGGQSDRFRAWMSFIVADQLRRGPSPRWQHRDCAGLARFAVAETLRGHDERWRRANGLSAQRLPPEVGLRAAQHAALQGWTTLDGERQAFVTALAMIQKNTVPLGRESALARPGDLIFFDQGDEQHLMIWMGAWIAYHTGQAAPDEAAGRRRDGRKDTYDNGLRAVTPAELLQWKDTRWRPRDDNPNFAGYFRLAFLSR